MPVEYDVGDGTFEIPRTLAQPYRIVYLVPNDPVPHEVQTNVASGALTVPRATRLHAPVPPAACGYRITPIGQTGTFVAPSIATSGAFIFDQDANHFTSTGASVDYSFDPKKALVGPAGAPEAARDDWILLMEWTANGSTSTVSGWARTSLDLVAGVFTAPATQPPWNTMTTTRSALQCPGSSCLPTFSTASAQQRLMTTVGAGTTSTAFAYGVTPLAELPNLVPAGPPIYGMRPLMIPFAVATAIPSSITLADPSAMLAFDRVVHGRVASSRTANGVVLTSALDVVTNQQSGSVAFAAPLADSIMIGNREIGRTAPDGLPIPTAGIAPLIFTLEASFAADDYLITLFEITNALPKPVRTFEVVEPTVYLEAELFAAGHTYVFSITSRVGWPNIDAADYTRAELPFSTATVFTRTFLAQ
jgi:hypothetical protein